MESNFFGTRFRKCPSPFLWGFEGEEFVRLVTELGWKGIRGQNLHWLSTFAYFLADQARVEVLFAKLVIRIPFPASQGYSDRFIGMVNDKCSYVYFFTSAVAKPSKRKERKFTKMPLQDRWILVHIQSMANENSCVSDHTCRSTLCVSSGLVGNWRQSVWLRLPRPFRCGWYTHKQCRSASRSHQLISHLQISVWK